MPVFIALTLQLYAKANRRAGLGRLSLQHLMG